MRGLHIQVLKATTIGEIDAAFTAVAQERADALFVAPDALFISRRVQLAVLTARDRIPAIYSIRDPVVAGGLASYEAKDRSSRLFFLHARHADLFPMRGLLPTL